MDFKVPIAERSEVWKDQPQFANTNKREDSAKGITQAKFGIGIQRLNEAERQNVQISNKTGVRVASVDPGSFAEDIGMQENDIILSINRQDITSPEDVTRIQQTLRPGQAVAFRVLRNLQLGGQNRLRAFMCRGSYRSSDERCAPSIYRTQGIDATNC